MGGGSLPQSWGWGCVGARLCPESARGPGRTPPPNQPPARPRLCLLKRSFDCAASQIKTIRGASTRHTGHLGKVTKCPLCTRHRAPSRKGSNSHVHCSVVQSCLTLCDPMDCSTPGFPVLHHFLRGSGIHTSALDLLWNLPTTDVQTPHFLRTQFPNAPIAHTPTQPKPSSVCLADWYPETWRPGPLLSCTGCSFLEIPGAAAAVWPHTPPRALRPQCQMSTQALYSGGSSRRGAGAELASRWGSRGPLPPTGTDWLTRCLLS